MSTVPLRLLGLGPQRTGSTWLDVQLRRHPELTLPAHVKETYFFDRHWDRGLGDYRRHFASGDAWAEVGPSYFDHPQVPGRVAAVAPEARAVATLRDPIARAQSLWLHHLRKGRVPNDFWAAAEREPSILGAGDYAEHVGRWREALGEGRVLVLVMEEVHADPAAALRALTDWAGLAPLAPAEDAGERVNAASAPRWPLAAKAAAGAVTLLHRARLHRVVALGKRMGLNKVYGGARGPLPSLNDADRERLADRYAPHVAFVNDLLGRDTGWLAAPSIPDHP